MFNNVQAIIVIILIMVCFAIIFYKDKIEKYVNLQVGLSLEDTDIYLINLERNTDRLNFFIEQYLQSDLKNKQFNRINAVDGKKIDIQDYVSPRAYKEIKEIEKTGYRTKHYQLTRGAIGCYLSHISAYTAIANGDKPYGLVFEDDVRIKPNIWKKLNEFLLTIPNNWDLLLNSCYCISCTKTEVYYDVKRFFWMHCLLLKKETAKKILEHLQNKLIEQQIDSELSDIASDGLIKIYCLKESLATQGNHFSTDIQMPLKIVSGTNPYSSIF